MGRDEGIVRVILTADNHLSAYSPKLSPAKLSERRRRLETAFQQTIDTAINRRAHLFIQAGDLFDRVDPRNQERDFVAGQLLRLQSAGVKTFAVSGNHDTPRQKTEQGVMLLRQFTIASGGCTTSTRQFVSSLCKSREQE